MRTLLLLALTFALGVSLGYAHKTYSNLLFFWKAKPSTPDIIDNLTDSSNLSNQTALKHLGIIMDGNRRWAKERGQAPWVGHKQGVNPVKTAVKFCLTHTIKFLTLYAFSLENFKRPEQELNYLFNVLAQEIENSELEELFKQGVCVKFAGDRNLFPKQLIKTIESIEEKTRNNTRLFLTILFCYGGQQEIIHAAQELARAVQSGTLSPNTITQENFEKQLWTGKLPPVDLIIRTGKSNRLSNFLTYYAAYSELCFLDCYWPEVTEKHLVAALEEFLNARRTFGK